MFRGSGHNPIVSFFGKHRDVDIISIYGLVLKVGEQSEEVNSGGECIVSKSKNAVGCQARIDDGAWSLAPYLLIPDEYG